MTFYLIPEITLGVVVLVGAYAYAVSPWNPDRPGRVDPWRISVFVIGAAVFFAALHPPIDTLSAEFFSIHMVQHMMVTFLAPPLLLLGIPAWMVTPLLRRPMVRVAFRWITQPLVAGLIGVSVFWGWHLPTLYEGALNDRIMHDTAHVTMVGSALLMWWPVVSRVPAAPAASVPIQMFYLFLLTLPSGLLSSLFVFAGEPLYPAYLLAAASARLQAAVAFYGGNTRVAWGEGEPPFERLGEIRCPVLGFFGGRDSNPSPEDRDAIDAELTRHGVEHRFHSFAGAGHGYMDFTNATRYHTESAADSWPLTLEFLRRHLTARC